MLTDSVYRLLQGFRGLLGQMRADSGAPGHEAGRTATAVSNEDPGRTGDGVSRNDLNGRCLQAPGTPAAPYRPCSTSNLCLNSAACGA